MVRPTDGECKLLESARLELRVFVEELSQLAFEVIRCGRHLVALPAVGTLAHHVSNKLLQTLTSCAPCVRAHGNDVRLPRPGVENKQPRHHSFSHVELRREGLDVVHIGHAEMHAGHLHG